MIINLLHNVWCGTSQPQENFNGQVHLPSAGKYTTPKPVAHFAESGVVKAGVSCIWTCTPTSPHIQTCSWRINEKCKFQGSTHRRFSTHSFDVSSQFPTISFAQLATYPKPFEARFTRTTQTSQDTCTKSQPDKGETPGQMKEHHFSLLLMMEVGNRCLQAILSNRGIFHSHDAGRKGAPQEKNENPGPKTLTSSKP